MPVPVPSSAPRRADAPPELAFAVEGAHAVKFAAVPTLMLALRVERVGGGPVRSIALNTQIRIAATQRSYREGEQERLVELFGRTDQWDKSLHSMLWTNIAVNVPTFTDSTLFDLPVPCTYDLEVSAGKYFQALHDGEVPLELLFSGTVFYSHADGQLQISPIPWSQDVDFRLPLGVWNETMDYYFPNSAWLRLGRAGFDRLCAYRARHVLPTWEATMERLLRDEPEEAV